MRDSEKFNKMLEQALTPVIEPSKELNEKIIDEIRENSNMKPKKRRVSIALVAVIITLTLSLTAMAAYHLLTAKQIAKEFKDEGLAHAFEQEDAVEINESVISKGYKFTLLGLVSGEDLSDFEMYSKDISSVRTWAVVSIEKDDGSEMPSTPEEGYGDVNFFISPLVKGQEPWFYNIASMNGGYSEDVIDGVLYRLIQCDNVEIFADRGVYLCISTSTFYDKKAFNYDEVTGEVSVNTDYDGANALFDLPLDIERADYDQAEKYLEEIMGKDEEDSVDNKESELGEIEETNNKWEEMVKEFDDAIVITESVKEVIPDEEGILHYEYEGSECNIHIEQVFYEEEISSRIVTIGGNNSGRKTATKFSRDANGTIRGMRLLLENNDIKDE
ncbi:hypothetical protein SH1V18_01220 [Vallitalea longa]|uniref:DUF4179 domain-containing protein n=1 Tax=Vallitalea longa TaxID=2936439 RepID=A0A9W5Y7C5_9FIRM|nr:DUF4179 domain-containing protein [Vallitalea longa]GKX27642.1 hypothetical protein SH1V18_01220 [Vallitalea longa]